MIVNDSCSFIALSLVLTWLPTLSHLPTALTRPTEQRCLTTFETFISTLVPLTTSQLSLACLQIVVGLQQGEAAEIKILTGATVVKASFYMYHHLSFS